MQQIVSERFITRGEVSILVQKESNRPLLEKGHEITVGKLPSGNTGRLRKVQVGACKRYKLTEVR